jgi:hypothetical protein
MRKENLQKDYLILQIRSKTLTCLRGGQDVGRATPGTAIFPSFRRLLPCICTLEKKDL